MNILSTYRVPSCHADRHLLSNRGLPVQHQQPGRIDNNICRKRMSEWINEWQKCFRIAQGTPGLLIKQMLILQWNFFKIIDQKYFMWRSYMTKGQILRKWGVYSNFMMQHFSRFESGLASHGRRQHLWVLVFRIRIEDYVLFQIGRSTVNIFLWYSIGVNFHIIKGNEPRWKYHHSFSIVYLSNQLVNIFVSRAQ